MDISSRSRPPKAVTAITSQEDSRTAFVSSSVCTNSEEASGIRLHRMQEIPIEFKTYVKVEVRGGEDSAAEPAAGEEHEVEAPAPAVVAGTAIGADGEVPEGPPRRLFRRS